MKHKRRWLLLLVPIALFAWAYRAASWRPKLIGVQPNADPKLSGLYSQLMVSPNGKRMVSYTSGRQRTLAVWNVALRKILWQHSKSPRGWIKPLAFSPDGQVLAVSSDAKAFGDELSGIDLVDVSTGQSRGHMVSTGYIELQSVGFLSARELVVASHQGVSVVETRTGKILRQWLFDSSVPARTHYPMLIQSHVSADGKTVVALAKGQSNTTVTLYDAQSGKKRRSWKVNSVYRRPRLSPDGTLCVLQRGSRLKADVYDCANGQRLWGPFVSHSIGLSWNWSADSQQITSFTNSDSSLSLFDARTGHVSRQTFVPGDTKVLALDARGDYFYTLDNTGKIWRWRAR